MRAWIGAGARFAAMAAVTLVVAHNLVFLAAYGARYGDALAMTGHDHGWTAAIAIVLVLGFGALAAGAWQLRRLGLIARRMETAGWAPKVPTAGLDRSALLRRWLWLALRLGAVSACLFVVQESIEHLSIGASPPGLAALSSPEYPNAAAIIGLVSLAIAFVGALFGWRRDILAARIRAARGRRSSPTLVRIPVRPELGLGSLLGRRLATRAPPLRLADQ
jgi:hypothetical protein